MSSTAVNPHLSLVRDVTASTPGCEECLRLNMQWVHLRLCLKDWRWCFIHEAYV